MKTDTLDTFVDHLGIFKILFSHKPAPFDIKDKLLDASRSIYQWN